MLKRKLAILCFGIFTLVLSTILVLVASLHQDAPTSPLYPNPTYLPGNTFDSIGLCNWTTLLYGTLVDCNAPYNSGRVDFEYDIAKQKILEATYPVNDRTIGDFIVAYGKPSGIWREESVIRVYFGNNYAWLSGGRLTPYSEVKYFTYTDAVESHKTVWLGFQN